MLFFCILYTMEDRLDNIKSIIDGMLGDPRRDYAGSGGWYEYNCPCCAEEKGMQDDKYNLAVQIDDEHLWCHCWRCGYAGKLSRLIRDYGTKLDGDAYRDELSAMRSSRLYTLGGPASDESDEGDIEEITLPNGFSLISENSNSKWAKSYLYGRGVGDGIIERYRIGFVGYGNGRMSNRIVIPSYDMYGSLNYWVARDYTGKAMAKIYNPNIDKTSIVFNEGLVNWYEPITLVEGPFDHIVTPNSIPLLGKTINEESAVFKAIMSKAKSRINILLDDDATESALKMYKMLDWHMPGRVRLIKCPDGYDASDYYKSFGYKGIVSLLRSARQVDDYTLSTVS